MYSIDEQKNFGIIDEKKEREKKKMTIHDYMVARKNIWGDESLNVEIVFENGKYFANCDSTLERRRLTESNYDSVLNDMFYNYCCENAAWMGVS